MSVVNEQTIVVAGSTGNLGHRIVASLRRRGARVVCLTRAGSAQDKVELLRNQGAEIKIVDSNSVSDIAGACAGASCVVSALLGLREVIVDAQTVLLRGAIQAGVPRFIPSDFSLDFNQLHPGENRNLDLHLEFQKVLDAAPIAATSILNGAFMELLVGQAPFILFKWKRVLYWQTPDMLLDFTTMDDVAEFTAAAALDSQTPRYLKIAGEQLTSRQLAQVVSEVTGEKFKVTWAGTLGTLSVMIKVMRALMPANNDPFPPWQGMQYSHNMFSGRGRLSPLDNARYPGIRFTSVREVLAARPASGTAAP